MCSRIPVAGRQDSLALRSGEAVKLLFNVLILFPAILTTVSAVTSKKGTQIERARLDQVRPERGQLTGQKVPMEAAPRSHCADRDRGVHSV